MIDRRFCSQGFVAAVGHPGWWKEPYRLEDAGAGEIGAPAREDHALREYPLGAPPHTGYCCPMQ